MLLSVAVDAAHPLLEARRIPRHVVVHHQPAELQVDAFARRVGRDQVVGAARIERTPEQIHLRLPLAVVEAAVNQRDLSGEAQPFEAAHQELGGVAVLGEDDELLPRELRTAQHAAQLLELGVLAVVDQRPRLGEQRFHLEAFLPELRQGRRDDAAQRALLERFVTLGAAGLLGVLVRGSGLEEVGGRGETLLAALQLFRTAGADQLDRFVQPDEAALERPQQRMRRAGLPALEHAHRQPRGRAVQHPRPVVGFGDVARRRLVECLFGRLQRIADRVATPLRIERPAVEADHLLLRAANEVPPALRFGERPERIERRQRVRRQQPPQAVPGEVLPHVRRRGQQQHVRRRPAQLPPRFVGRQPGQRLGEAIAIRLVDGQVLPLVGGQLVRLVEDHQVVRRRSRRRLAQPSKRMLSHERVDADDHPVALRPRERIAGARVRAPHDAERQREQRPHLPFPVADQAGRRHDQHAPDQPARQHLAQVEAGHDRLARPRVVGEQET